MSSIGFRCPLNIPCLEFRLYCRMLILKLVSHYLLYNSKGIDSNVGTVTIISVKTPAPEI
jgi:hypothetical protein